MATARFYSLYLYSFACLPVLAAMATVTELVAANNIRQLSKIPHIITIGFAAKASWRQNCIFNHK